MEAKKRNIFITVVVLAGIIIFRYLYYNEEVSVDISENILTVEAGEYNSEIDLRTVKTIELMEDVDYGECNQGTETKKMSYGVFQNAEWGLYDLYVHTNITNCIVIASDEKVVVNYESEEVTEVFYNALCSYMEEHVS